MGDPSWSSGSAIIFHGCSLQRSESGESELDLVGFLQIKRMFLNIMVYKDFGAWGSPTLV